ncbi:hypothetical protein VPHD456G2_0030 [Vibrio phage D456 g2]|nr:hypothetical protein NVP1254O_29 [Vibrio phage 1.254.O._10N.286.45.C8]CAH9013459.1 conserved hypothetical protein [Vibrio phage 417E50-1]CAH9015854.1 conserved hypothetical protein [Vibrio phage 237E40-1]
MNKITWLATAAELEMELLVLKGKVLTGCLTQKQAIEECLLIGLDDVWQLLDVQLFSDTSLAGKLTTDLWTSIQELESEMGLHLCVPY